MAELSLMERCLSATRSLWIVSLLCAAQTWLLLIPGIESLLGTYVVLRTFVLSLTLMLWSVLLVAHLDDRSIHASLLIRRLSVFFLSLVVVVPIALRSTATLTVLYSPRTFLLQSIMNASTFDGVRHYRVVSDGCDVDYEGFDAGSLGPVKHGLFRVSRNGRVIDEMVYRLSQRNGKLSSWWDSGAVMINGNYTDDKPIGLWDFHNESGDRQLKVQFTESGTAHVIDATVNGGGGEVVKGELNPDALKNVLHEMSIDWLYYQ